VNNFYTDVYKFNDGTIPNGDDLEQYKLGNGTDKYPGVIPFMLQNSFGTVEKMNSEKGVLNLWAYGELQEVQKSMAEAVGKVTGTVLSPIVKLLAPVLSLF
jgi:hypothetical protein